MVTQRLDGPFTATRRYGPGALPLAFDILTLPFQIANTLTGVPPMEVPYFGPASLNGPVAPGPTPAPAPAPITSYSWTTYDWKLIPDYGNVIQAAWLNGDPTLRSLFAEYPNPTTINSVYATLFFGQAPAPAPAPVTSVSITGIFGV